jgi:hypothetical protein
VIRECRLGAVLLFGPGAHFGGEAKTRLKQGKLRRLIRIDQPGERIMNRAAESPTRTDGNPGREIQTQEISTKSWNANAVESVPTVRPLQQAADRRDLPAEPDTRWEKPKAGQE